MKVTNRVLAGLVCLGSLSCGSEEEKTAAQPQAVQKKDCDLTPIDGRGTLPACAAGRSTESGPGRPADFAVPALPPAWQSEPSVEAAAEELARNPPTQDPVDRGFGRPSSTAVAQ